MWKLLPAAIATIALVGANPAHAIKFRTVLSTQIELKGCVPQTVKLRQDDAGSTICVVSGLGGSFAGEGEFGSLRKDNLGNWEFHGQSCQPRTFVVVTCFRAQ